MTYANVLHALGDQRRREILESLSATPLSVGEIAKRQPVSRPAVSQHLKVLISANLVNVEQVGTRRLYHVRREGLDELRRWLDHFWDETLGAYEAEVKRQIEDANG